YIAAPLQFTPDLPEEGLYALRLDGLEGHPVRAGSTLIGFGHLVRRTQRLHLADVNIQPPEPPLRFRLRLDIQLPPQVLQGNRRLYHPACLPSCRKHLTHQGPFAPRALLRFIASTGPSDSRSTSIAFPVLPVIRPTFFRCFVPPGRDGSLQLLSASCVTLL